MRAGLLAALLTAALSASAFAQGYAVRPATTRLATRPGDFARRLDVGSASAANSAAYVELPFRFAYYGRRFGGLVVSAHGWIRPVDPPRPGESVSMSGDDGAISPMAAAYRFVNDGSARAGAVWTWTTGAAPKRTFVVSWENVSVGTDARVVVQAQLSEGTGSIVFTYETLAVATGGPSPAQLSYVCGLDEPGGPRTTAPTGKLRDNHEFPAVASFVLEPRTVLANDERAANCGDAVAWQAGKRESLSADDSARPCSYVGKGSFWFWTPDRAFDVLGRRRAELAAEDKRRFGGATGDPERWIRQVLDAKAHLVMRDGTPVRFWFRVVEYFTIDERGCSGSDDHVWNLRVMLGRVFPADDPRSKIENYAAWRCAAAGRLTVVKLFDASQKDDAGKQYTSNRKNEYVLWTARYRADSRANLDGSPLPDHDCPAEGWSRFTMRDDAPDKLAVHHADKADLREVVDPEYVDGRYEYVVRSDADPSGWVNRSKTRFPAMTEESVDDDPRRPPR